VRIDFSSHLQDAWVDTDFIDFGRKVTIGQGAVVMSSMVVGDYLIIKKVRIGDYSLIGGVANVSPGAIIEKESVIGAFTNVNLNQIIESGWVYIGLPAKKYKPYKYAEEGKKVVYKTDVVSETKYEVEKEKRNSTKKEEDGG
jgi:carbonic anhydrase/acetyltransferase-like protein (isoleucine patch superfamily)